MTATLEKLLLLTDVYDIYINTLKATATYQQILIISMLCIGCIFNGNQIWITFPLSHTKLLK